MKFTLLLLIAVSPLFNNVIAQGPASYAIYCNARYGYCINYSGKILKPQREAQNGDGRAFKDKNGKEILVVYGHRNDDSDGNPIPIQKIYALELKGGEFHEHPNRVITYSKLGKMFYVISGTENGKIFYQKTIQLKGDNDDCMADAILTYHESEKDIYDVASKQIFNSFK